MKKLLALLLALVMILSLCACGDSSKDDDDEEEKPRTYKDAIDDYVEACYKGKTGKIKSLAPKEYWDWREEEYGETAQEVTQEYAETFERREESWREYYGDDYKVSYEVVDKEKLDEDTLELFADALEDEYDIEFSVTEGYEVELEMTIEGSEDEDSDEATFYVLKIDGDWYVIDGYYDGYDSVDYAYFNVP